MNSHESIKGLPPRRIQDVALELGLDPEKILLHGRHIAKIPLAEAMPGGRTAHGKLILVTAMSPRPREKARPPRPSVWATRCERWGCDPRSACANPRSAPTSASRAAEPARAGRRYARLRPSICTSSVTCIRSKKPTICSPPCSTITCNTATSWQIDPRRIVLRRVIDLNDRALREIIIGLGGVKKGRPPQGRRQHHPGQRSHGHPLPRPRFPGPRRAARPHGHRLHHKGEPVRPARSRRSAPCRCCCSDAINPNIVQTLEGTPAFVHGGPFANIAQGTNTAIATRPRFR